VAAIITKHVIKLALSLGALYTEYVGTVCINNNNNNIDMVITLTNIWLYLGNSV